jgi:hypothetical protein
MRKHTVANLEDILSNYAARARGANRVQGNAFARSYRIG